ncbi:MAG TPA: hypothetical protein VFT32_07735, partial [Candidatus Eisenbacteria bacterium]|nr:hypothetical protein [Candidatus Eisenbacteria bacterium]
MRRLLALVLGALLPAMLHAAEPLPAPDPYVASTTDSLRHAAIVALEERRFDAVRETCRELLRRNPGDGLAYRELMSCFRDGDPAAVPKVLRDGKGLLRGHTPGAASLAYVRGLDAYYRLRYQTALEHWREAERARPGWGWPLLYQARALERLGAPKEDVERIVRSILRDPDVAPLAYVELMDAGEPGDPAVAGAHGDSIAAWVSRIPWAASFARRTAIWRDAFRENWDLAACEAAWLRARELDGPLAVSAAAALSAYVAHALPQPVAFEFLEAREREGAAAWIWRWPLGTGRLESGSRREARAVADRAGEREA